MANSKVMKNGDTNKNLNSRACQNTNLATSSGNHLVNMTEIQGIYSVWTLAKHLNNVTWEAISSYKTRKPGMELKRK